jgi:glyoxylase I family protein
VKARSFSHVGITVSDFNRAVRFYWDVFGAPLVGVADAPPERVRGFFGVDVPGATCKIGWVRVPGGGVIEIFHFTPAAPPRPVEWGRIGLTHTCLNVRGIHRWHQYLISKGVEIVCPPEQSPRGHWLFFVKDFDGNLIEITDLGFMYYVLGWLGPLGGWLFRRGMYKRYYQ